ncbi:immunity protein Imm33 domain-containing protein [Peribacillus simplex]|uniref:Imm33-like domain-containing protein n=1 Tax=Peribacillus simplex TaxID=1478 RepID=A0AAW7IBP8_9BACI|nr:hypothetical protein [Peribacillus simplex]MDM5450969.1 hypothetical protein [Peribacillus simplex]
MKYEILVDNKSMEVKSIGAISYGLYDIVVKIGSDELIEPAKEFITFTLNYQIDSGKKINPGQSMTYGYWLVKFEKCNMHLEVWEYDLNATKFIKGADLALRYWEEQLYICEELDADFEPPTADKTVMLSKNILEEDGIIQGVRYFGEAQSSGWLLYRDEEDLDEEKERNLITLRLHELTAKKSDLVCFFGLPSGYRFIIEDDGYDAWCDENIVE